jgi:hypothetical protein
MTELAAPRSPRSSLFVDDNRDRFFIITMAHPNKKTSLPFRRFAGNGLLWAAALLANPAWAQAEPAFASALKTRHQALQAALAQNQFQQPIHLSSSENSGELKGEIHAIVPKPLSAVSAALKARQNWCDLLILHLNVKQCRSTPDGGLGLFIGKKYNQPLDDAYKVNFSYKVTAVGDNHLQVQLNAPEGPLGTRDYRIVLEAVPLDEQRTFMRLSYSYGFGLTARMAMKAYLSTVGSDKVGFSIVERESNGAPVYVKGVRGVVERNTMRYFLAIDSYLNAQSLPPAQQPERRLHNWFAATERYPKQLHEVDEKQYLEMKRQEIKRQQP